LSCEGMKIAQISAHEDFHSSGFVNGHEKSDNNR